MADHNLLIDDAGLVDPAAGDFQLDEASPAIDEGVEIPSVHDDVAGVSRPQGAGYDIGAHERVP